jgi:inner membrane protein
MTGPTHAAIGTLAGATIARLAGLHDPTLAIAAAAGALLPDADQPGSRVYRRVIPYAAATVALSHFAGIPMPRPLTFAAWTALAFLAAGLLSEHRGATHSLAAIAATTAAALAAGAGLHGLALAAGVATHVAADAITPGGVRFLWPSRHRNSWPLVQTGGATDRLVGITCAIAAATLMIG